MPNLDINIWKNCDYLQDWQLLDNCDFPIDISDITLSLKIRYVAGQGPLISSAQIDKYEPSEGRFTIKITKTSLSSVITGSEVVKLAYDLIMSDIDGNTTMLVGGHINLLPGVTY